MGESLFALRGSRAAAMRSLVNRTPFFRCLLTGFILLFALTGRSAAQNVLLALHDGKACPVVAAWKNRPMIEIDGKRVEAEGRRLALHKTDEFLPVFIGINGLRVGSSHLNAMGKAINNEWHFRAWFETPYRLNEVFLVLEMKMESGESPLFLYEVGDLEPGNPKFIELTVPLNFPMGKGRHQIHLFTGGQEVLHSQIPEARREAVVDRMIAKRVSSIQDAEPKPFIGPSPEYPVKLLKAKTKGQAIISLEVGRNGRVHDLQVKSATDPLFGEAALAAARMWRFFPMVKNGKPQAHQVDLPFDFTPPAKRGKDS